MKGLRALSGVLAGGLVVLALALVAAALLAGRAGFPGPGTAMLGWHVAAAVAAVAAQWVVDRRRDQAGFVAALVVVAITAAVLAGLWLA